MNEVPLQYLITERRKIPNTLVYTPEALQSLVDEASGKIQLIIAIGKKNPEFFMLFITEEQKRLEYLEGHKPSWSRICAGYVTERFVGGFLWGKTVGHLYGNPSGSDLFAMWFDLGYGASSLMSGIPVTEGKHPSGLMLLEKRLEVYRNGLETVYGDPGILLKGAELGLQAYRAVYEFSEQFPMQK